MGSVSAPAFDKSTAYWDNQYHLRDKDAVNDRRKQAKI